MNKKYAAALRQFQPYYDAAQEICQKHQTAAALLTAQVTAPVLFTFVWYVLGQAERMGLKRLYFLSESGNAMLEIAREITKVCPVSLELRYLHCSEAALLLPVLHRMEPEEAVSELFRAPEQKSLKALLDKAAFTPEQRAALRAELLLPEETALLSEEDYRAVCTSLRSSVKFRRMMTENSKAAHTAALGYLVQAGLTDGTVFGIVHAGRTCLIQRYLCLLSESILSVTGFYFALSTRQKAAADGVHHTWYFSADSAPGLRVRFCWPLFRSMCAPPHGCTISYRNEEGHYAPVLSANPSDKYKTQADICREFAALCAEQINYGEFPVKPMRRLSRKLLTKLMLRPTAEEAELFSTLITDDVGERLWPYGRLAVSALPLKGLRRWGIQQRDTAAILLDRFRSM